MCISFRYYLYIYFNIYIYIILINFDIYLKDLNLWSNALKVKKNEMQKKREYGIYKEKKLWEVRD